MTPPAQAEDIARSVAERLAPTRGETLPATVEGALQDPERTQPTKFDPVSIAGLIVSIASLAWTIYSDLKRETPAPTPETLTKTLRVQLRNGGLDPDQHRQLVDITVEETIGTEASPSDRSA